MAGGLVSGIPPDIVIDAARLTEHPASTSGSFLCVVYGFPPIQEEIDEEFMDNAVRVRGLFGTARRDYARTATACGDRRTCD